MLRGWIGRRGGGQFSSVGLTGGHHHGHEPPGHAHSFVRSFVHSFTRCRVLSFVTVRYPSIPVSHIVEAFTLPCSLDDFTSLQEKHLEASLDRLGKAWGQMLVEVIGDQLAGKGQGQRGGQRKREGKAVATEVVAPVASTDDGDVKGDVKEAAEQEVASGGGEAGAVGAARVPRWEFYGRERDHFQGSRRSMNE